MQGVRRFCRESCWTETSAAEALTEFIGKDYNRMTKTIAELIGGIDVKADTFDLQMIWLPSREKTMF